MVGCFKVTIRFVKNITSQELKYQQIICQNNKLSVLLVFAEKFTLTPKSKVIFCKLPEAFDSQQIGTQKYIRLTGVNFFKKIQISLRTYKQI